MTNYNTLGCNFKRGLLDFIIKISRGFKKTTLRFIAEMVFGIIAANSCKLTDIGRALKEKILLKKTIDRLGRNLSSFSYNEALMENYLAAVRPTLGDHFMLLIDGSDATKPCSPKMEAIGTVYDASKGCYADGYWTMGVVALTEETYQTIPVYEKLYPCIKQGGAGFNHETENALSFIRNHFSPSTVRIFDRGFDSGKIIAELVKNDEKFILRASQNRVAVHKGQKTKIDDVVRGLRCEHKLEFNSKTGNKSICEIGMTEITLSKEGNTKLKLVVCKEFGDKPLVLYTNLDDDLNDIAVMVVKAYLMRWRIEEYHAFKKQELGFEDFRVRSLSAIQTLDLLLTIAVGYIGILSSKAKESEFVLGLILISKRIPKLRNFIETTKLFLYAVHKGITTILASIRSGIHVYCTSVQQDAQITLPLS